MRGAIVIGIAVVFVLSGSGSWGAPAAAVGVGAPVMPAAKRSENGLYSADISSDTPNEILVGVYRHEGEARVLQWGKRIGWRGANAAAPFVFQVNRFISNDGNSVILRNRQYSDEAWVWISKEGEPKRFYPHDIERALGKKLLVYHYGSGAFERYQGILEFIYEPKGVFAIWFPALNAWVTIDLASGKLSGPNADLKDVLSLFPGDTTSAPRGSVTEDWLKPPSEDLVKLLDVEAKRRSIEAVRKHQPHAIENLLRPWREKISGFIPALKPAPQPVLQSLPETYAGYIFLARRKDPEAEKYIRKLLAFPFRQNFTFGFFSPPSFMVHSEERMLGDVVWRIWNDEVVEVEPRSARPLMGFPVMLPQMQRETGKYLGTVAGEVRLPMVRPDKDPGNVWVYLIPVEMRPGAWTSGKNVVALFCPLDTGGGGMPLSAKPQFDRLSYGFKTVTPGEYRLKVVWDRRGPYAPADGKGLPEPGDYESVESDSFTVRAGEMVNGPTMECTNRVGEAHVYYRADEAWQRANPTPRLNAAHFGHLGNLSFRSFNDFPMPRRTWILKTNTIAKMVNNIATEAIRLKRAEVVQVLPKGDPLERGELFLTFEVTGAARAKANIVPNIRDAHGCLFQATAALTPLKEGPSELTVRVPVFPRNEEFTFELRYIPDNTVLCSYTMQNQGAAQKARWRPRSLPIARAFGGDTIRLTQLTRSTGVRFERQSSERTTLWVPDTVVYQDSEGNRTLNPSEFCKEEKVLAVEIVHQELMRSFTAAVANE